MNKLLLFLALVPACLFGQNLLPSAAGGTEVQHHYYTLSYSEEHEQALWVAYTLTPDMINGAVSRTDNFREDPKVASGSASLSDYKGSGYDRGHLAPASDMRINLTAMTESFYLSNMSPQNPSFNRGIWKKLETLTRNWAAAMDTLYLATGPIFRNNLESIGMNRVTVPGYFYKVMYNPRDQQMIAFVLPNQKSGAALSTFAKTVDEVERLTGIDFFYALDDSLEHALEATVEIGRWDFSVVSTSTQASRNSKSTAVQCMGTAKSTGQRCKNKTRNPNGYCHLHQAQARHKTPPVYTHDGRCEATTQSGSRCKRKATDGNRYCWQHKR